MSKNAHKQETDNLTSIPEIGLLTTIISMGKITAFVVINDDLLVSYVDLDVKQEQMGPSIHI